MMASGRERSAAWSASVLVLAFALAAAGCGYGPAHTSAGSGHTFALAPGPVHVADADAVAAFEAGARAELIREGAIARCSPAEDGACSSIVIELLALEDAPLGISARGEGQPVGLASTMTAAGRATIFSEAGREDLGEARTSEVVAAPPNAAADVVVRREAARRAARRLGERLVRRALGMPEPLSD